MTSTQPGPLGFARMAGSLIAGRDAAAWVTDFLNAAYYRRPEGARDVDDLRLAFCILTTRRCGRGGLMGQTFEIEVAAGTKAGGPMFTRGYVTITSLVPRALRDWFAALEHGLARHGNGEPRAVPEGGEPLVGFDLTTQEGHFMGSGYNRLLLYTLDGKAYVRAAGTWDPKPWHVDAAYKLAGSDAQHAFWGQNDEVSLSLLHQLARRIAG